MKQKKNTKGGKATIRTPVKNLKGKETIEHYNAVLLEDIRSKVEQVAEGVDTTRNELRCEIREFKEDVNDRLTLVDAAIRKHSDAINENTKRIEAMEEQVGQMEIRLINAISTRLDEHESKPVNIAHRAA